MNAPARLATASPTTDHEQHLLLRIARMEERSAAMLRALRVAETELRSVVLDAHHCGSDAPSARTALGMVSSAIDQGVTPCN